MEMPQILFEAMLAHVQGAKPEEACGLIAGLDGRATQLYPVENQLHSANEYEMEPVAQIKAMLALEAEGWEMLGIYHSHPHGPAMPSMTDLARAYYPDAQYVIISLQDSQRPSVRNFFLQDGVAREIPFVVV